MITTLLQAIPKLPDVPAPPPAEAGPDAWAQWVGASLLIVVLALFCWVVVVIMRNMGRQGRSLESLAKAVPAAVESAIDRADTRHREDMRAMRNEHREERERIERGWQERWEVTQRGCHAIQNRWRERLVGDPDLGTVDELPPPNGRDDPH